jgi:DNA-binding CsgD family transcriptional regulator
MLQTIPLTPSEIRVLELIAQGESPAEISKNNHFASDYVYRLLGSIRKKFRLPRSCSLVAVVLRACERELIPSPFPINRPHPTGRANTDYAKVLTRKELLVFKLLADPSFAQQSDAQKAEYLKLSPATVRTHLQKIYAKLGVENIAGAVRLSTLAYGASPWRTHEEQN